MGILFFMSSHLDLLWQRYPQLQTCRHAIEKMCALLISLFENGGKLLIAGNGGSAADAGHISCELLKNFCKQRPIPAHIAEKLNSAIIPNLEGALPAIPLADFSAFHTAYANDRNAEYAFAQLVLALGNPNDALLVISTSGNSKNMLHAIHVANAKNMPILGLSGASGGIMKRYCTVCVCVPETETFKVQELHLPIYHALCQALESHFFK
ncbi:MAG: SIS domain-containing protein [Puniceicoccales bacterium]|jgi:D-sedoheptulose 7-phosphate isomerase|nr:SIS domain-containing protein [Puniceicoccales bacterium]